MTERAMKTLTLGSKVFVVEGLGHDDPYFASVVNGFEPEFDALCDKLIGPESVCLDIGANIGIKTLVMSRGAGRVIAVEAGRGIAEILRRNTAGIANVSVVHCAVSDQDGEIGFRELSAYGHVGAGQPTVPSRTVDSILAEHGGRVDFIKIDVEGYEWTILQNALDTINRNRAFALVEFNSWCLMSHAEVLPIAFAKWLLANFTHVYAVRGSEFERVKEARSFVHRNLLRDGCVTDVLITNSPERLKPLFGGTVDP